MSFYKQFADPEVLLESVQGQDLPVYPVNAHLHTPYSFSAFTSIADALDRAVAEGVKVVGINDFYSTDGYEEWAAQCAVRHLFPLFNIEFISLNQSFQDAGIRANDPNNPGRVYLSGKGLRFPLRLEQPWLGQLEGVKAASNQHVAQMRSEEHTSELQSRPHLVCRPPSSTLFPYTTLFRSPLFNIEFISLNQSFQDAGIRANDPNNPGRVYLSGKGLRFPLRLEQPWLGQLEGVKAASNQHVAQMCARLNEVLAQTKAGFALSYADIERELANGSVRERHLAKALRLEVEHRFTDAVGQKAFYDRLLAPHTLQSPVDDAAAVENELRGRLLKAGGLAFVPEGPDAFLAMETVRQIILKAGGLPTYPFLADDAKGLFTDFEGDKEQAARDLEERGFASVEFITTRNSMEVLEEYAAYFYERGFVVTFGSEHNTPAMEPIALRARGDLPLSPLLQELNLKGAALTAAHQYLVARGEQGYLDADGRPRTAERARMELLGQALFAQV